MSVMHKMMFSVYHSELTFDETVAALRTSAQEHGWDIPMEHDLQENYQAAGYEDMTRVTTLYFCNPEGGYRILQHDEHKPMAVMMPMARSWPAGPSCNTSRASASHCGIRPHGA